MVNCRSKFSTSPSLRVDGDALFQECVGLQNLRGCFGGSVKLAGKTGVKVIGADFDCTRHLIISDCPRVEILNCRAAGNVLIENSSLRKTGPAFYCGGNLSIINSKDLEHLRGVLCGDLVFESPYQKIKEIKLELHDPEGAPLPPPSLSEPPRPSDPTPLLRRREKLSPRDSARLL
jgi:hypothetical protein